MVTEHTDTPKPDMVHSTGFYYALQRPSERLQSVLPSAYNPAGESAEDHRDRLFLQILLSLLVNILALIGIFYFLLPLSEQGRDTGGMLLWAVFGVTVCITGVFLKLGARVICANLLLATLGAVLFGASFVLGGVMSPTMIFLVAIPVLAATLMHSRWAFFWTALTVAAWLGILVLENNGVEMSRVTRDANVGTVQVISLLGTVLVVMAVLGSYVAANGRLRNAMVEKTMRLDYLASTDPLTSIANRRAFFEHAQQCLQRATRTGKPFSLVVIDLNDFKQINDNLGHKVGDAVLQHFAQHLSTAFRDTDFVGRLGGDEFGVVLEHMDNTESVSLALQRFQASSAELEVDGHTVRYGCAIGTSTYPEHGDNIVDLYEAADTAMYQSKPGTDKL